jgi:hypothetical protein
LQGREVRRGVHQSHTKALASPLLRKLIAFNFFKEMWGDVGGG